MIWVLYLEHLLKLALLVLDFSLVVHLYRANIVELYWEPHGLCQSYRCFRQYIVGLFDSQKPFIGPQSGPLEVEN